MLLLRKRSGFERLLKESQLLGVIEILFWKQMISWGWWTKQAGSGPVLRTWTCDDRRCFPLTLRCMSGEDHC